MDQLSRTRFSQSSLRRGNRPECRSWIARLLLFSAVSDLTPFRAFSMARLSSAGDVCALPRGANENVSTDIGTRPSGLRNRRRHSSLIGKAQAAMAKINQYRLQQTGQQQDCQRSADYDDRQRALGLRSDAC
jgi:hypothetical protein